LAIIVGTLDAWEKARALAWEQINEYLALAWEQINKYLRQHLRPTLSPALLPVGRKPPAGLTLDAALADLRDAARWVELTCPRFPPDFAWLIIARGLPYPLDSQARAEHGLEALANIPTPFRVTRKKRKVLDTEFLDREVIRPVQEHAEQIRAWLLASKERALRESLTDTERKALSTLYALRAFDPDSRFSIRDVARKAEGKQWANDGPYRAAIPALVAKGLAATKEGRRGGAWLTPDGRAVARGVRRRR
jgi:hypothetical protein